MPKAVFAAGPLGIRSRKRLIGAALRYVALAVFTVFAVVPISYMALAVLGGGL